MKKGWLVVSAMFLLLMGVLAGCGSSTSGSNGKEKVVIGYFPNIDHVPAMVAREKAMYEEALGDKYEVEYKTFPDGGAFMTALKTGDIQGGLVGPGPAMNNYVSGADVKVVAGASSGGTVIIASKESGITSVEELDGATFITPGVGCTHDVQMETFLQDYGLSSARIGGSMKHVTGNPAQYAGMFESESVDAAAVPEPWASLLSIEHGANILVDSNEISFGTTLPNTIFVTSGKLIDENKELVQKLVDAHQESVDFISENPEESKEIAINSIKELTNQELSKEVIDSAWERIRFTHEVDAEVVQEFANSSFELKFLKEKPDFTEFIDSQFVN
ncbi:aliphatic sulfonate ABC transporter substrate-binding protein [Sutcliffiella horikoshii]|uniref:Aliphatic sulfonate ABC transporter substrate-binding protein n=1 Tax=Sutcliffiella horikoshii TaxID=79883 RepID=A0AA95B8T7_9BACI|nr:aliphatic sulfonate ABC transporter substrate-binding protein [Sutcliffiella horikoshii]TYS61146.1 aliphatic sulfonate ABC transporter substrate-binding protein [Sutcliffiella horikoshii]